jgi:hypothetical protein
MSKVEFAIYRYNCCYNKVYMIIFLYIDEYPYPLLDSYMICEPSEFNILF